MSDTVQTTTDKHARLLEELQQEVARVIATEGWQAWLRVATHFHNYSVHNQFLIMCQRPEATRVAGYKAWQAMGRQVNKGEQGIRILAPNTRRAVDNETGEKKTVVTGFRFVSVFDVAQTSGDPLPSIELPPVTVDDSTLLLRLVWVAENAGLTVDFTDEDEGEVRGWYTPEAKRITIVDRYDVGSQTRTLLHELAHYCDPATTMEGVAHTPQCRAVLEVVAESAAFLVGARIGVDLAETSAVYLASWSTNDADLIRNVAGHALSVAECLGQLIAGENVR